MTSKEAFESAYRSAGFIPTEEAYRGWQACEAHYRAKLEWQPIETAPKMGMQEILVYDGDWFFDGATVACWDAVKERWINPDREDDHILNPTDWMPIPNPPIPRLSKEDV